MRSLLYTLGLVLAGFICYHPGQAQLLPNSRPIIISQQPLATESGKPITIQLTDLVVVDLDDPYPQGFTLTVYTGKHYEVSGTTVTPDDDYSGNLNVSISVSDGESESRQFDLRITVTEPENIPPVITGQVPLTIEENTSITITLTHLLVTDPDNDFPGDFTLRVYSGDNYERDGHRITPDQGFIGTLGVDVSVDDGDDNSDRFTLRIVVIPENEPPVITGQSSLSMEENSSFTLSLSHLKVTDPDNKYPDDFRLKVNPGQNYNVSGSTITPTTDFTGSLNVGVLVNDGIDDSNLFTVRITVVPNNVPPVITGHQTLAFNEDGSLQIKLADLTVTDPDNDYPADFTLEVLPGESYTVKGHTVSSQANFHGMLSVPVTVNDGKVSSEPYKVSITVNPVNDAPEVQNLESNPLSFFVGKSPAKISTRVEVADVDKDNITVGEIALDEATYRAGIDLLEYDKTETPAINGIFDRGLGVLFLIGNAPAAEYTKAVRNVSYNLVVGEDAVNLDSTKLITIKVNDGLLDSEPVSREIELVKGIMLEIPLAFTPNGDAANDTWKVQSMNSSDDYPDALIRVYTIRGTVVYEAQGLHNEWDGRHNGDLLPTDTYYYTINLNVPYTNATYKGMVTILR